jgi:hypothetical protein
MAVNVAAKPGRRAVGLPGERKRALEETAESGSSSSSSSMANGCVWGGDLECDALVAHVHY